MNVPYIPGNAPPPELPLGRFLPPIPAGMVRTWCQRFLKPGDWVLDPFGFSPQMVIEVAAAGHPVLVTVNNPIHGFMLKVLASAPQEDALTAALQDLAVSSKGDERMEPYIRSLYHVVCRSCRRKIEADAFLWKKGEDQPYAALVECENCGASGEQLLTEEGLESLTPLPPKQLHHARALNRIVDANDPFRPQVEDALDAYPARPLIVLQTIINKIESLEQSPQQREHLIALILTAADQGNTLWSHPSPRDRPRQIVIPPVYKEKNLWKVLESAVKSWQAVNTPLPISDWQGFPPEPNGIIRFQGRIKELAPLLEDDFFSAVLTAIPRPNQAFWTLSALWTGWIWGKEAVSPIRTVLSRQRYDWNWHTNALVKVFETIHTIVQSETHVFGLIAENEPMLLLSALLAGDTAGFALSQYAQSLDDQIAQCSWHKNPASRVYVKPEEAMKIAVQKITAYLREKGEPASYQKIHAAAMAGLAHENKLAVDIFHQNTSQMASEVNKWVENIFEISGELVRVGGGTASVETGDWWLANPKQVSPPLIDRVEEKIVRHLIAEQTTTAMAIKNIVYEAFPGIFTPADAVLLNTLDSYAELIDPETHRWQLKESENPSARNKDIAEIRTSLMGIAERLNYKFIDSEPLSFFEDDETKPVYSFFVFASSIVSKYIPQNRLPARMNILVFPGSRANLLAFKEQRDPVLKETLNRNFLMVKFRLIRDLEANPLLSRELFKEQIRVDPPEYQASQLALF